MSASESTGFARGGGRCPHCDGTGDVHTIDGEWRGRCSCPVGEAIEAAYKEAVALAERAGIDMMDDHHLFLKDMTDTLLRFAAISAPPVGPLTPEAEPKPQTWRDLDDKRLQLAIDAFYEPCEGTTIDGVRAAILAWEQSR